MLHGCVFTVAESLSTYWLPRSSPGALVSSVVCQAVSSVSEDSQLSAQSQKQAEKEPIAPALVQ